MEYTVKNGEQVNEIPMERIIDEYGSSIWRMCYMYLKNKQLAEDAMQDTLVKIYEKYHTFNKTSSEKTWIMRIAINTCKNYLKTNWLRRVVIGIEKTEETGEKDLAPEETILEKEQEQMLLKNILKLKNKYKDVILLYYYQEMKIREIAEVLEISEASVSMRLQRGRIALKDILGEES